MRGRRYAFARRVGTGQRRRAAHGGWWILARTAGEVVALLAVALIAVVAVLGRLAAYFEGSGLWSHILPFAAVVLALGVGAALALRLWFAVRRGLQRYASILPLTVAGAAAATAVWFASGAAFDRGATDLGTLFGGPQAAARAAIAHQVFASYRRADLADVLRILERGRVYEPTVHEAATAFGVDAEVLMGIGATESAFYPRDSNDGGRGLFQITAAPQSATAAAQKRLGTKTLDPLNQRHNAFVAAATLQRYLSEMHGDQFLGLLAYNIGPRNGGLVSIMKQYGARDFMTIQPYLQKLPRDYPIRVLTAALAYRLWRTEGRLPRYEEGANARRIQKIGVPGLQSAAPSLTRPVEGGAPSSPGGGG